MKTEAKRRLAIRLVCWISIVVCGMTFSAVADDTGTDPTEKYTWGENIGWVNFGPSNCEVVVHFDGGAGWLSGHGYGENVGWIVMGHGGGGPYANTSTDDWGVNLLASGNLSGYAWGENIGWINFGCAECDAAISPTNGEFSGHAWGENVGWLKLRGAVPDYGVRTLAFDTQTQGTPNWWLDHHSVAEDYDTGDGVAAWQKYVMDTNPNVFGDYLRLTFGSTSPWGTVVTVTPTSTNRYYTLVRIEDLASGVGHPVYGETDIAGNGGEQAMHDTGMATLSFYVVEVEVEP